MSASKAKPRDVYAGAGDLRGVWTRGEEPQELVLSDGSRLALRPAEHGQTRWQRSEGRDVTAGPVSAGEAAALAGEEFASYVSVRTRAEAEWLRTVAEWCDEEARRLEHELSAS